MKDGDMKDKFLNSEIISTNQTIGNVAVRTQSTIDNSHCYSPSQTIEYHPYKVLKTECVTNLFVDC